MEKTYAKFMKWGRLVNNKSSEVFKLIEDMDNNNNTVKVVNMNNWKRYDLLKAWIRNYESNSMGFRDRFDENIEDCKKEMQSYETELQITDIEPANKIQFITPNYKTKFEVKNLDSILVNGESRRVIFLDETHFQFEKGSCYHICQWAELCDKNGIEINPI
jgi:hypothetical protein